MGMRYNVFEDSSYVSKYKVYLLPYALFFTIVFKLHCWGFSCVYTCQRNISLSRSAMLFVCTFGVVYLEAMLEGKFQPQTSTGGKQRYENMGEVWERKLTKLEGRIWSHLGWGLSDVWLWSFLVFTEGDQQSITAEKVAGQPYILLKGKHSHPKTQTHTNPCAHKDTHLVLLPSFDPVGAHFSCRSFCELERWTICPAGTGDTCSKCQDVLYSVWTVCFNHRLLLSAWNNWKEILFFMLVCVFFSIKGDRVGCQSSGLTYEALLPTLILDPALLRLARQSYKQRTYKVEFVKSSYCHDWTKMALTLSCHLHYVIQTSYVAWTSKWVLVLSPKRLLF